MVSCVARFGPKTVKTAGWTHPGQHIENGTNLDNLNVRSGKLHRVYPLGPANRRWYESGQRSLESWRLNGELHRVGGPAYQTWRESRLSCTLWYQDGKEHRVGGPSSRSWRESGQLKYEIWRQNGEHHRIGGSVMRIWDESGKLIDPRTYVYGKRVVNLRRYLTRRGLIQ